MAEPHTTGFAKGFGQRRPPAGTQHLPAGALPGMTAVGKGWTIWMVARRQGLAENTGNLGIASATKSYQLIRVRDVHHDVGYKQYRPLDSSKFIVKEFETFMEAQRAFADDALKYTGKAFRLGVAGLFP